MSGSIVKRFIRQMAGKRQTLQIPGLGGRIEADLRERGETQIDLAGRSALSRQTVNRAINSNEVTPSSLRAIAEALEVTMDDLRGAKHALAASHGHATVSADLQRLSDYDAGYIAGELDRIAADAQAIIERTQRARSRLQAGGPTTLPPGVGGGFSDVPPNEEGKKRA